LEEVDKKFFCNLKLERNKYTIVLSDLPPMFSVKKMKNRLMKNYKSGKSKNPYLKMLEMDMNF